MTNRQMRSVELEFAESAPVRLVFTAEVAAPPAGSEPGAGREPPRRGPGGSRR
ncbi:MULTISPECIES: hypothetical protein [unclassified Streptomyces]|uniref:hypothetical protein n=1 Tax=unclassified Streptomyces TaxID=2593676 RepID=UPI003870757C